MWYNNAVSSTVSKPNPRALTADQYIEALQRRHAKRLERLAKAAPHLQAKIARRWYDRWRRANGKKVLS